MMGAEYDLWEEFALKGPTLVHVCRLLGLILEAVSAFGGGDMTELKANAAWIDRLHTPEEKAIMEEREAKRAQERQMASHRSRVLAALAAAKDREKENG